MADRKTKPSHVFSDGTQDFISSPVTQHLHATAPPTGRSPTHLLPCQPPTPPTSLLTPTVRRWLLINQSSVQIFCWRMKTTSSLHPPLLLSSSSSSSLPSTSPRGNDGISLEESLPLPSLRGEGPRNHRHKKTSLGGRADSLFLSLANIKQVPPLICSFV